MKNVLIMPLLAAVLCAAACGDATGVGTTARVRFFNGTTGLTGGFRRGVALTANHSRCPGNS